MIRGARFESNSDTGILTPLNFASSGNSATAVIGDENTGFAGTIFEWSIDGSGRLVIAEDGYEQEYFIIKLVSYSDDSVEVRESIFGFTTRYKRSKE